MQIGNTRCTPRCSRRRRIARPEQRRGAMLVLVAVMLIIILVMAVFSVDVARMHLARTELRTAADAAAHAATETLNRTQSTREARRAAMEVARQNQVAGKGLELDVDDIIFGRAENTDGTFAFAAHATPFNAVRIRGQRTQDSLDGPVPLFLGGILGRKTFEPTVQCSSVSITRDIALVLDRSGSMRGQKLRDLQAAVGVFLDVLEGTHADERVSLASYATRGAHHVSMTSNLREIRDQVNAMRASGYTAIGQGMQIGSDSLRLDPDSRPHAEKTIILMTDGKENRNPPANEIVPQVIAAYQACFTISFGRGANQELMRDIARRTGGRTYHAADGESLREVFEDIARTLAVVMIE